MSGKKKHGRVLFKDQQFFDDKLMGGYLSENRVPSTRTDFACKFFRRCTLTLCTLTCCVCPGAALRLGCVCDLSLPILAVNTQPVWYHPSLMSGPESVDQKMTRLVVHKKSIT